MKDNFDINDLFKEETIKEKMVSKDVKDTSRLRSWHRESIRNTVFNYRNNREII